MFDTNKAKMEKWYNFFGFEEHNFTSWKTFDGLGDRFGVFKRMDKIIQ